MKIKKIMSFMLVFVLCISSSVVALAANDYEYYLDKAQYHLDQAEKANNATGEAVNERDYYKQQAIENEKEADEYFDKSQEYYNDAKGNFKALGYSTGFAMLLDQSALSSLGGVITAIKNIPVGHKLLLVNLQRETLSDLNKSNSYLEKALEKNKKAVNYYKLAIKYAEEAEEHQEDYKYNMDKYEYYLNKAKESN